MEFVVTAEERMYKNHAFLLYIFIGNVSGVFELFDTFPLFCFCSCFLSVQCLFNICNDIFHIFDTYREADQVRLYAGFD